MNGDRSEQINELAAALAKAQGQLRNAPTNRENQFKGRYADLASFIDTIREPLSSNSLAFTQLINNHSLKTWLFHTSGQWLSSEMALPPVNKIQELGSALTYYRRYQLSSLIGVSADDDDDAAASTARGEKVVRRTPPAPAENVMRAFQGADPNALPPHDPETGEVRQEEVDSSSARPSPAGPAASDINPGAAGSLPSIEAIKEADRRLAEEAAKGVEALKVYWEGLGAPLQHALESALKRRHKPTAVAYDANK